MNEKQRVALLLACVVCCSSVMAGDPLQRFSGCSEVPDCVGRWCCDDYCSKKEPCVSVALRFGCNDYCKKRLPCVRPELGFTCDNYCKKCPPKVCTATRTEWLRCGPRCGFQDTANGNPPAPNAPTSTQIEMSKRSGTPSQESYDSLARPLVRQGGNVETIWKPVIVETPAFANTE